MLLQSKIGDSKPGSIDNPVKKPEPERILLILTTIPAVSGPLIDAIEREFPWIHVEQVDRVDEACRIFAHPVSLMLIDGALVKEAEAAASRLRAAHPQALAAVIEPHDKFAAITVREIALSPLIRSVLPMDLRLDVWLSVIRLMLWGGEYLPFTSIVDAIASGGATAPEGGVTPVAQNTAGLTELTTRELQILEMVCAGLQNKLIAAEFALSEHTVKIHLHNIMRKLGVHNRTEAAARYRSFTNGR